VTLLVQQDQSKESRPTADKDRLRAIVAQGDLGLPALAGQAGVFGQADLEGQPMACPAASLTTAITRPFRPQKPEGPSDDDLTPRAVGVVVGTTGNVVRPIWFC